MDPITVGIITGKAEDRSGPALVTLLESGELFPAETREIKVVPDEKEDIQAAVAELAPRCDLVLTSGGTGFAARDVTPEAVSPLLERPAPGLVAAMLNGSLAITPMAMLSRPVAGVRGRCVVVTLPGSTKGAVENLRLLAPGLPHAVDLVRNRLTQVQDVHRQLQDGDETGGEKTAARETTTDSTTLSVDAGSRKTSLTSDSAKTSPPAAAGHQHQCPHQLQYTAAGDSTVDLSQVSARDRRSPYPAISLSEAQKITIDAVSAHQPTVETVNITAALGRVLAEDVSARVPLPPFPASVKDGYAVLAADGVGIRRVLGASNAGVDDGGASETVLAGTCVRISTGAPLPAGADAVVMVENTRLVEASPDGRRELRVEILAAPAEGQDIRPIGSDMAVDTPVASRGTRLGAFELAALAAAGVCELQVYSRPTVAVLSTGNEVQEPGQPLAAGRIYDTNRLTLLSALPAAGAEVIDAGIAIDEPGVQLAAMRSALRRADVLVTTGGVSMGERDIIKRLLTQDLGATIHFGRCFMKPGMPTTFASLTMDGRPKFVFGLPGNPVSAAVCSVLHVLPTLRRMAGLTDYRYSTLSVRLEREVRLDPRPEFVRATLTPSAGGGRPTARATGSQQSSNVRSLCGATVLLQLPASSQRCAQLPAGAEVDAILLHGHL
ncbi:Gephyrin [Amphibalanus amphitrite]|uniref:molybdopterin adenylyltransferase n=1 Tax=Amphibalanus amphitrite TaxID=1232801 RepID=A0A6A4VB07_AMPAM|nr:Gephyrin [Amphibalanus amphitrite]